MMTVNERTSEYPVDPMFLERWSPRAFSGEPMPKEDLLSMIDAARWAASAFNSQPWRFLYVLRDQATWPTFLGLLNAYNQSWAAQASALVIVVSSTLMVPIGQDKHVLSRSHSFDTGMAASQFILQGLKLGYHSHCMTGFDIGRTMLELNVPETYHVEVAIAVGQQGDAASLPEALQQRERPSIRRALDEIAIAGSFPPRA